MEEESTKAEAHVRSYHSWFQDQSVPLGSDIRVLSSASLQDIALENPYSFLKTQIRLEAIASRVDERRLHGVRPTGRPDVTMR